MLFRAMQLKFRKARVRAMLIQDKDYFGSVNVKIIKFVELGEGEETKKDRKNPEELDLADQKKSFGVEEFSMSFLKRSYVLKNFTLVLRNEIDVDRSVDDGGSEADSNVSGCLMIFYFFD